MPDMFTTAERSRVMRAIKARGTATEERIRELLQRCSVRCREQASDLPGCPDFVNNRLRIVVFVDGDFWHGRWWRRGGKFPSEHRLYWLAKFRRNRERDRQVNRRLRRRGWAVVRIWESELLSRPNDVMAVLAARLAKRRTDMKRRALANAQE